MPEIGVAIKKADSAALVVTVGRKFAPVFLAWVVEVAAKSVWANYKENAVVDALFMFFDKDEAARRGNAANACYFEFLELALCG